MWTGVVDTSEFAHYGDDGPEVGGVDAFWTYYSRTTLRAESLRAQREWLAAHPQVENAWNADTAWYAKRVDAAKQLIAEEEGEAGKVPAAHGSSAADCQPGRTALVSGSGCASGV